MDKKIRIAGILLISLGFLVLLSLVHFNPDEPVPVEGNEVRHSMGLVGFWISFFLIIKTIGYAAYVFPLLMLAWGINLVRKEPFENLLKISLYALLVAFYFSIGFAIFKLPKLIPADQIEAVANNPNWGVIGGFTNFLMYRLFGEIGTYLVYITVVLITIYSIFEFRLPAFMEPVAAFFSNIVSFFSVRFGSKKMSRKPRIVPGRNYPVINGNVAARQDGSHEQTAIPPDSDIAKPVKKTEIKNTPTKEAPSKPKQEDSATRSLLPGTEDEIIDREYISPNVDLLDRLPEAEEEVSWDEFMVSAKTLEEKLADFGIQGKVVEINPGPVITRYEIEPAPGIKVNRFTSLADDLALVMRAKRIRVVAPIPGKAAIGIEIPNRKPSIVYLREILDSPQFKSSNDRIPLALGQTIAGDIYVFDMVSMPHLLVAGATGSGKSVCLNTIIASILYKAHPDKVQLVMIDPKRLELTPYKVLKNHHLIYREDLNEEVVTTPNNAVMVLRSLEREMERRYELLARAGVRNIEDYNNWVNAQPGGQSEIGETFEEIPYIVLIIDELADLMLTAAREVEEPIARLTQMSRAVGIHLIVATQRPSVDVITGVIKANFPARMAFQVATKTDSRTILDMNGAEKLLGKGDMLFLPPGSPEPIRIHNAFVSHEEIKRLIEHIKKQPPATKKAKLATEEDGDMFKSFGGRGDDRDELFNEALKLVVRHQQGSSSLLQRRLKIGYTRAARIIDQLEQAGFVGPYDGSKARQVLIGDEELAEMGLI